MNAREQAAEAAGWRREFIHGNGIDAELWISPDGNRAQYDPPELEPHPMSRECDGRCEPHVGAVQRVRVSMHGKDWGRFNYCLAAIMQDRRNGYTVTTESEPPAQGETPHGV